jgi:hypothetical protein
MRKLTPIFVGKNYGPALIKSTLFKDPPSTLLLKSSTKTKARRKS